MSEEPENKNISGYKDLGLTAVDFHFIKNNFEHHTMDITVDRLIIRRGKPFSLTLCLQHTFYPIQDFIELTAETGPGASEEKGTRSSFGTLQHVGSSSGKPWSMKVLESTPLTVTLSVLCPPNASIGLYSLTLKTGSSAASDKCLGTVTVLFNPWCEDDWVYLPKEEERNEYVKNELGVLYRGVHKYIVAMAWDLGQDGILDICLKLLDVNPKCLKNPQNDYSARCNPIYISRVISAMINCNDDNGVLMGQWDQPYTEGVDPAQWCSSVDILRQWMRSDCSPVKFGQCWVFAAVMCTVMRCLGIPCRVVTNYQSAHDTDGNLTIDDYYNESGLRLKTTSDSVWNFHVWVEAWMKRPDLSKDSYYDGWQVLDPTPQEKSAGTFCCGPAPVKAIHEGHTNVKYDVPFVYAEVNADRIGWLVTPNSTKIKILSDTRMVGQFISTKAVGEFLRQDITDNYKYQEGSVWERDANKEAVKRMNNLQLIDETPLPNLDMKIHLDGAPLNGVDIKLILTLNSESSKPQDLSLMINAQAMKYTGIPAANIWNRTKDIQLFPKKEQSIPFIIPFAAYGPKMLYNNCIKVSVIASDKGNPKVPYLVDKDIVPHNPSLYLTVTGTPLQYSQMTAEVMFENPLSVPLKNCIFTLSGSGLLKQTELYEVSEIEPRQRFTMKVKFTPYRDGPKKLVAGFDCSTFRDIKASTDVNIIPISTLPESRIRGLRGTAV